MPALKKIIPFKARRYYKLILRTSRDLLNGTHKKISTTYNNEIKFHCIKSIVQLIKISETSQFKTHNIGIAITRLNNIRIGPGQIFSFWKMVGNPSQKNGYKKSRSIIGNSLQEEVGGGLCQLSGLVYYLALHAGLTITERHPHSLDIYQEEDRFTPLGSDATVVYGYKDLRFENKYPFPVSFNFSITDSCLTGTITAMEKIELHTIEFDYQKFNAHTRVATISIFNGQSSTIAINNYGYLKK